MGRLAIVIPSIGDAAALEQTLLSVLENRPPYCDVVAVHRHPYADPYQLADEIRLLPAPSRAGYVECVNLGLQACKADVVHLLAAGSSVTDGWTDGVLRHFNDPRVAVVAPLLVDERDPSRALATGIRYTAGGLRKADRAIAQEIRAAGLTAVLAAPLAAAFYNRLTLETVGGLFSGVGADLADLDLGLRLRHAGFTTLVDPRSSVSVVERPLEKVGSFRAALQAERLFWRNAPLLGWAPSVAAHPWAIVADATRLLPGFGVLGNVAGRMVGLCGALSHGRYHQRLADLHDSAPVAVKHGKQVLLRLDPPHGAPDTRQADAPARVR